MHSISCRDNCSVVSTDGKVDFYLGAGRDLCDSVIEGTHIILGNVEHSTIQGLPCLAGTAKRINLWLPMGGETFLRTYLSPPFFWGDLDLRIFYHEIEVGSTFEVEGWTVTPKMLKSRGWNYGFRFDKGGSSFASLPREEPDAEFSKDCQFVIDEHSNGNFSLVNK